MASVSRRSPFPPAFLLAAIFSASGSRILLGEVVIVSKEGKNIVGGSVKSESEKEVELEIYRGFTKAVPKSAVAERINVDRSRPEERKELADRLAKLGKDDVAGHVALIQWARAKGLGILAAPTLHGLSQRAPNDAAVQALLPPRAERKRLTESETAFLEEQVVAFFKQSGERAKVLAELKGRDVLPRDSVEFWAKRCFEEARKGPKVQAGDFAFKHTGSDFEGRVHIELWRKAAPDPKPNAPAQEEEWPVVVSLHGGGLKAGSWQDGGPTVFGLFRKHFDRLMLVAPNVLQQNYAEWGGNPLEEVYVRELFRAVKRTWRVDTSRVYLAGYSMGGYGTWHMGGHQADLFAGLFSGAGGLLIGAPLRHAWGWGTIGNLMHTPIAFLHGGQDKDAPPWSDEEANKILSALAAQHPGCYRTKYLYYPQAGHGVPGEGGEQAVAWVSQFTRNPYPKKVLWEPKRAHNQQFYWLRLDKPDIFLRLYAEIEANTVRIKTEHVYGGLTVFLNHQLLDLAKPVRVEIDGRAAFDGLIQPTLSAVLETVESRIDERQWFPARIDF